jgi:DNA-binding CsgD family transcriptional regulator
MDPAQTASIDLVEAAYDLELGAADWLPNALKAGRQVFDLGMGFVGAWWSGASEDGQPLIVQMHVSEGAEDLPARFTRAAQASGPELVAQTTQALSGGVNVLSEDRGRWPQVYEAMTSHLGCKDLLGLWAMDPDLYGTSLPIPSPEIIRLTPRARDHWRMLVVHLTAGRRLRRHIDEPQVRGVPPTDMPFDAEALLDPTRFVISQATAGAKSKIASTVIREAAVRVDKARGKLRKSNPEEALEIWHGLVRGRWSLVDWFDTDGRRFVLAKPNAPNLSDPRGLTEREAQVATYAALGESSKIIGYRFGISPQRVSTLRTTAMRKLGVKTPAQLVEKLRGFARSKEEN